jgi:CheY-like chemotaxis protein
MSRHQRCRVLVVEDEAAISLLVEDMVDEFGSEIVGPVASVDSALDIAASAELDAALLDVNLGGAIVYPVADLLASRGVPFAFLTGYSLTSLPDRFRHVRLLTKPFNYASLAALLREMLAGAPCSNEAA